MELRILGRTGIKVSPLCLGGMMFGGDAATPQEATAIIHRALDSGINFIDTADEYWGGESEEIIGRALAGGRRDTVVLATKVSSPMGADPNQTGNSRRWIIREVEDSLRRLGTDWIDLYQMHAPDPDTDIDDTLGALTDLVQAGKVRYIGSSAFHASHIVEARWVATARGRERFATEQPPYSLVTRVIENDVLPTCQRHKIGVLTYSPLAGGWLTGRFRTGGEQPRSFRVDRSRAYFDMSLPDNQRKLEAVDALAVIAEDAGMALGQMALAFVITHPAVTAAIIGPRTSEQLDAYLHALDVKLSDELLDRVDEVVPPGVNVDHRDRGWNDPALDARARRRPAEAPAQS
jgi:aryl-alcohol dehydrogenase-like predicted oxidoreductase